MKSSILFIITIIILLSFSSCAGRKSVSYKYDKREKKSIKRKDRTYQRHHSGKRYKCHTSF